jgi:hypothetical protein
MLASVALLAPRPTGAQNVARFVEAPAVDKAPLLAVAQRNPSLQRPDVGPLEVTHVWRWTPPSRAPLVVWNTCRGSGDTRGCVLTLGELRGRVARSLRTIASGWQPAQVTATPDGASLLIAGSSGRGAWTARVFFVRGVMRVVGPTYAEP